MNTTAKQLGIGAALLAGLAWLLSSKNIKAQQEL